MGFMATYSNRDVYTTDISYLAISFRSKVHKVSQMTLTTGSSTENEDPVIENKNAPS